MTISSSSLLDAGRLSEAAYNSDESDQFRTASLALFGTGFRLVDYHELTSLDIGDFSEGGVETGYYDNLNSQALVAYRETDRTLVLSFRGTDSALDLATDALSGFLSFNSYYNNFDPLIAAVFQTINQGILDVDQLLVTGHSLGGAAAELFMTQHDASFGNITCVTFGSPGNNILGSLPGFDDRVFNFWHTGDPVHDATIGDINKGTDVRIALPDSPNVGLTELLTGNVYEHSRELYKLTASAIASSTFFEIFRVEPGVFNIVVDEAGGFNASPTGGRDFMIGLGGADVISGGAGSDLLEGGQGEDRLFGDGGVDFLAGGDDDDHLKGGMGNDEINGGSGVDTAVFSFLVGDYRPDYSRPVQSSDFYIKALSDRTTDGTDHLKGIERLKFFDWEGTVAEFFAKYPENPPTPSVPVPSLEVNNPTPAIPSTPTPSTPPVMTVSTVQNVAEGNSGSSVAYFTVTLSHAPTVPVSFIWSVIGGSQFGQASSGTDFKFEAQTITIPAGRQSWTVPVTIYGDQQVEPDETYSVVLSNLNGARFADGGSIVSRQGVIRNDDGGASPPPPPAPVAVPGPIFLQLYESSTSQVEGASGTETIFEYTLRRTGDLSVETSARFEVQGFGASPAGATDFVGGSYPVQNVTFQPGEGSKTFQVRVNGDATSEAHEYFKVVATARSPGVEAQTGRLLPRSSTTTARHCRRRPGTCMCRSGLSMSRNWKGRGTARN